LDKSLNQSSVDQKENSESDQLLNELNSNQIFDKQKSIFETLFKINVNEHIRQKNGLSYLSWTYAWAEVKKKFPDTNYKIYENHDGLFYHTDGKTCWVKTGVTINQLEHIEYLPVMDSKNCSIKLENITSFDANRAIQRSLTKALARHGLGLYIYAGEDLPENETEKISDFEVANLEKIINTNCANKDPEIYQKIRKKYKINNFKELTIEQYSKLFNELEELNF
jgi:hypothetical protein